MERYNAVNQYHAWYEHWHRYHWIAPHLNSKIVADLACGEGYGSALLGQYAEQVWAIDIDQKTIQSAKEKYQSQTHVKYIAADILQTPMKNESMDAVVSFETLEHLSAHSELLIEFKRVLKKSGFLVISTPDKLVYSSSGEHNEYHVKELSVTEFQQLINEHFNHAIYFGQQLQTNSLISPVQSQARGTSFQNLLVKQGDENVLLTNQENPTYLIAVASNDLDAIKPFRPLSDSTFNDVNNSLFHHYEAQVKRLLEADKRLAAQEQQLKQQSSVITQLQARLGL